MCGPRSWLLRLLETLVYSPLLLTGATTQRQWLEISYFTEFYNDPGNMAATITITIQSQFIQVTTLAIVHTVPAEGPYLRCEIIKTLVGTFNKEKAIGGASSGRF